MLLFFSINFFYAQNENTVIQVHGQALIFGDYYTEISTPKKEIVIDKKEIKSKRFSVIVKNKKKKQISKKVLAATEDLQKERLKKIVSCLKTIEIEFNCQSTTKNTFEISSGKKTSFGTISFKYVFGNINFELHYLTLYIYRDLYVIESPKFSKDVSNLISGRAPPTLA